MAYQLLSGDCLDLMRGMPDKSVDLVFTSPPYEDCRTYGIQFSLKGQEFVDWCVDRYLECLRVSKGLVAWVIEGKTKNFRYSAVPILLAADLHRRGVKLRKPPIFHRVGIPGSGGKEWLRNDYELIICATHGKLPWSDNTACGHPPKWAPGGEMSNRQSNGARVNQWGHSINSGATVVESDGRVRSRGRRPSHVLAERDDFGFTPGTKSTPQSDRRKGAKSRVKVHQKKDGTEVLRETPQVMTLDRDGTKQQSQVGYTIPKMANPGNVLKFIVGGGVMGHKLCHENEAPFPLTLAEFFIKSFCPPGGTVLDPFCGSGTTIHAAEINGRDSIGIDVRQSQIDLTKRRLEDVISNLKGEERP